MGEKAKPIAVRAVKVETGEESIYTSIGNACRGTGVSPATIRTHAEKEVTMGYFFTYLTDEELAEWEEEERRRIELQDKPQLFDLENPKDYIGKHQGKKSVIQLAQELNISCEEVKRLFDEWLGDRKRRNDWQFYQHMI